MRRGKKAKLSSVQIIALGFFIIILTGTALLMLPWATRDGGGASFSDALFTATSASCVTGLVMRDTGTYWTLFGQTVIICLIQVGGLGFMTIATLFMLLLRRRLGLREREVMVSSVSYDRLGGLLPFVRSILMGTLLVEGLGAALLSIRFAGDFGPVRGIYYGIWHSISAFCNAGFDLMGAHYGEFCSFTAYAADPLVVLTVCGLILVGGLGFLVWEDLVRKGLHWRRYRLQTKVVLVMSLLLAAGGTGLFLLLERNNLGAGLPLGDQILAALFDAVTPRTAGFNSTDTASLSAGSLLLTIIFMFIGGNPGSTAGGIKTEYVLLLRRPAGAERQRLWPEHRGRRAEAGHGGALYEPAPGSDGGGGDLPGADPAADGRALRDLLRHRHRGHDHGHHPQSHAGQPGGDHLPHVLRPGGEHLLCRGPAGEAGTAPGDPPQGGHHHRLNYLED